MDYVKQEKLPNTQNVNNITKFYHMPKPNIHPTWNEKTPVFCDGKPICYIGSTKKELNIDVWLINHPFYTASQTLIDSEGRVERFMKKYDLQST